MRNDGGNLSDCARTLELIEALRHLPGMAFGRLLPGMNATAEIEVSSASNALAVPNGSVVRGNYVLVTKDSPSAANAVQDMTAPDGYVYVKITTGTSDNDSIEVTGGLQEGDTIAYDTSTVSATDFYSNMMVSAEGGDE